MISIKNFVETDFTTSTLALIEEELKYSNEKVRGELIFNRHSLEFNHLERIVTVFDDIEPDEKPLEIDFDEFLSVLKNNE